MSADATPAPALPPLSVPGRAAVRLDPAHPEALERLAERCGDYQVIEYGRVDSRAMAAEVLTLSPPGHEDGKYVWGFPAADGELEGVLDVVRDYPTPGEWFIGLLLLDPPVRGRGVGEQVLRACEAWALAHGGRALQIAVLEHNAPARRFWERQGFAETRRAPYTASSGKTSEAIVMRKALG